MGLYVFVEKLAICHLFLHCIGNPVMQTYNITPGKMPYGLSHRKTLKVLSVWEDTVTFLVMILSEIHSLATF